MLHYAVLCCIVFCHVVLNCIELYCIIRPCAVLCCIELVLNMDVCLYLHVQLYALVFMLRWVVLGYIVIITVSV